MFGWFHCFRLCQARNTRVEGRGGGRLLTSAPLVAVREHKRRVAPIWLISSFPIVFSYELIRGWLPSWSSHFSAVPLAGDQAFSMRMFRGYFIPKPLWIMWPRFPASLLYGGSKVVCILQCASINSTVYIYLVVSELRIEPGSWCTKCMPYHRARPVVPHLHFYSR
jgi:hypothetical protein